MGDDGIGIKVAEHLSSHLEKENIEVILAETDVDYALSKVENGDFIFIIDSTYLGVSPGTITLTSIRDSNAGQHHMYSQHQPSLINLLKTYRKSVEGFVIGIEIEEIDFKLELSHTLNAKLLQICEEVDELIFNIIRGKKNA